MRRLLAVILTVSMILVLRLQPTHAAPQVSARRALDTVLPELRFDNIPLTDAIDFVRDVSGVNLHVNWRAVEEAGIPKETTINVRLRSVTLRKVLDLVLSEAARGNSLAYYIDQNVLEITTRELADRDLITRLYPVDDLLLEVPDFSQDAPQFQIQQTRTGRGGGGGGGQIFGNLGQSNQNQNQNTRQSKADQLIALIKATVQPAVWNDSGGPAAISFFNGSLIVTAPRSVHEALGGPTEP